MKAYRGLGLHKREREEKGLRKGAKSRGLKPRIKIILFLSLKSYIIFFPKFLSGRNELPSGGQDSSFSVKCQKGHMYI